MGLEIWKDLATAIYSPVLRLIGYYSKKNERKTNRVLELLSNTGEFNQKILGSFLMQELYRKVINELEGVEFTKEELDIIEKVINDTSNKIKWPDIKVAYKYLVFDKVGLLSDIPSNEKFMNKILAKVGILGMVLSIVGLCVAMFRCPNIKNAGLSVFFTYCLIALSIFFAFFGWSASILFSTQPYFSAEKINEELNK